MTDDDLAHAWESFATALADVPAQRALRFLRGEMSPEAAAACSRQNEIWNRHYAMMARNSQNPYVRGIRPDIFGFGIMI